MKVNQSDQIGLFENTIKKNTDSIKNTETSDHTEKHENSGPLANISRPKDFSGFIGQSHIFKRYPFLRSTKIPSLILWGPPGTGKTTLANILASNSNKELYLFNAVLGGVNDLKKLINSALAMHETCGAEPLIFIDEIHRFNKAQQDALLPYVEQGAFTLIGATTENPRSSVNRALLSRVHSVELKRLTEKDLFDIIKKSAVKFDIEIDNKNIEFIADHSNGDARNALNTLDVIYKHQLENSKTLSIQGIRKLILENGRDYDKNKDRHYDVISAFIKSIRGSDPDAAVLWLAVMLDGGEDPVFIARRLIISAAEDIGNADPSALTLATAALTAVQSIGMPEARICLAQATTYLASTVKSNACYLSIDEALSFVRSQTTISVPNHLRNYPPKGTPKYKYPHDYPNHYVEQEYFDTNTPTFYRPSNFGMEKNLKLRLENLKNK